MFGQKSRLTKAEIAKEAKKHDLRVAGPVKERLATSDDRPVIERAMAFEIAEDITKSLGKKTVSEYYLDAGFALLDICKAVEESGKRMSRSAVKDMIHAKEAPRVDGTKGKTQSSPGTESLLATQVDAEAVPQILEAAHTMMLDHKQATLGEKYVRPLVNGYLKCKTQLI